MSKVKFYRMTKPLPFRRTRLFLKQAQDSITSVTYNILYKLNIIDKYSITDVLRSEVRDFSISNTSFTSGCVTATLVFTIEKDEFIDEEYYHKKGNRLNKLLVLKDTHEESYLVSVCMIRIGLLLPGERNFTYVADGLPVFKMYVKPPEVAPASMTLEKPVENIARINMRPLQSLRFQYKSPSINEDKLRYMKEKAVREFEHYFKDVTFAHLLRGEL